MSSQAFSNTDELWLDIIAVQDTQLRPDSSGQKSPGDIFSRTNVGKDDLGKDAVSMNVALTRVRQCRLVRRQQSQMINLQTAVLCLFKIWGNRIRGLLDVRCEIEIVLAFCLTLRTIQLRSDGPVPFSIKVLLCLGHTMCAVAGIFVLGEGCYRRVHLGLKAVDVWLDLLDLRRYICLIVGV